MSGHVHVGTVGFRHPHWIGEVYPRGASAAEQLLQYATQFTALQLPLDGIGDLRLTSGLEDTPLRLTVVLPAQWIHLPGRGLPFHPGLDALETLTASGMLAGLRLPLATNLPPERARAVRLRRLAKIFADQGLVVDLPSGAWRAPAVLHWLDRIGVSTSWHAIPAAPSPPRTSGPTGLVHVPSPERQAHRHGSTALGRLVPGICRLARTRAEVVVLLQDGGRGAGTARDAEELIEMLLDAGLVVGGREKRELARLRAACPG